MNNSNNNNINPVRSYKNADIEKSAVLYENKGKIGIYMGTNLINKKRYIGSSRNLHIRLREYYNINYLQKTNSM
jgi:hypothetical protein